MPSTAQLEADLKPRRKGRPRTAEIGAPGLVEILNIVRTQRATTRQELERESEYGRAVVADRLSMLLDLMLIDESELGTANGGRAPRLIRFSANRGCILVATFNQTSLGVGLADLSGHLKMEHHEALDLAQPVSVLFDRLVTLFRWLLDMQRVAVEVWGVSISVPAAVADGADTLFLQSTPPVRPGWESFLIVEKLVKIFDAPVWLRSNVETMTMGEFHAGAGADNAHKTMLFVKVGKRIGAGMVSEHTLFRGEQGAVGLIGAVPVFANERHGTLESLAGADAVAQEGKALAESGMSTILAEHLRRGNEITSVEVVQAAQMGDQAAIELLSQSGRLVGHAVATLANMLNPGLIVLSGAIAESNDFLLASAREAIYRASHPLVSRNLQIICSQMGSSSGLVGAAIIAVEAMFSPVMLREWIMAGRPQAHPQFIALKALLEAKTTAPELVAKPPKV